VHLGSPTDPSAPLAQGFPTIPYYPASCYADGSIVTFRPKLLLRRGSPAGARGVSYGSPTDLQVISRKGYFPRIPYATDMATGYSVPTSERDISSADVSASSGSFTAVQGPMKKAKPMPTTVVGDGGSCTVFRGSNNFPALAAITSSVPTVNMHGQMQSSSESSVSGTISSSSRLRRAKLATAKIAAARVVLAEARLAEIQADADLGDDASSDSNARRYSRRSQRSR